MAEKLIATGKDKDGKAVEFHHDEKHKLLVVRRPQTDKEKETRKPGERVQNVDHSDKVWDTLEAKGFKRDAAAATK